MHKIDRDKLREDLSAPMTVAATNPAYTESGEVEYQYSIKPSILQAAENWLEISDPGFEAPESMWDGLPRAIMLGRDLGYNTAHEMRGHLENSGYEIPDWLSKELPYDKHLSKGDICVIIFKAMIAKAGE